jgi:hypothetical protein
MNQQKRENNNNIMSGVREGQKKSKEGTQGLEEGKNTDQTE